MYLYLYLYHRQPHTLQECIIIVSIVQSKTKLIYILLHIFHGNVMEYAISVYVLCSHLQI